MAIETMRFWCQKVLPLVYDNSLSYYELLCKVVAKINEIVPVTNEISQNIESVVNEILTEWLEDGTLEEIIGSALGDLQNDIDAVSDRVSTIEKKYIPFKLTGVKTILIGNSYAAGTGGTNGRGWCYYFEEITGVDAYVIHQNGGDFIAPGNQNASYPNVTAVQALTNYANTLTTAQKNEVKLIVYGGGYNDHNYIGTSLVTAVTNFVTTARTLFPNAKVVIVPMYCGAKFTSSDLFHYGNYIAKGALEAGAVTTENAFTWLYGRGFHNEDNIHPTDSGYKVLGYYTASLVQGWDGIYQPVLGAGVEYESDVSSVGFRYVRGRDAISFTGALRIADEVGTVPRKLATLPDTFLPYTSTYFPVFLFDETVGNRSVGVCYLNSQGLWLANANNTFPDGLTIYFGNTISYYL